MAMAQALLRPAGSRLWGTADQFMNRIRRRRWHLPMVPTVQAGGLPHGLGDFDRLAGCRQTPDDRSLRQRRRTEDCNGKGVLRGAKFSSCDRYAAERTA